MTERRSRLSGASEQPSGSLAFGSPDLISEIHHILATYHRRWTGARPPGIYQAAHAPPYMPVRELGRVRPPIRNILVCGSQFLRQLIFLHCVLSASLESSQGSIIDQSSTDQSRYIS